MKPIYKSNPSQRMVIKLAKESQLLLPKLRENIIWQQIHSREEI